MTGERAVASYAEEQGGGHGGHTLPSAESFEDPLIQHDPAHVVAGQDSVVVSTQESYDYDVSISGTIPIGEDVQQGRDTDGLLAEIERDTAKDEAKAEEVPPSRITRPIPPPPVNLRSKPTPPSSPPLSPPPRAPAQTVRVEQEECPPSPDIAPRPVPPPGRSGTCCGIERSGALG